MGFRAFLICVCLIIFSILTTSVDARSSGSRRFRNSGGGSSGSGGSGPHWLTILEIIAGLTFVIIIIGVLIRICCCKKTPKDYYVDPYPLPPLEDPPVYPAYLQADAVPYKPNVEDHVVDPHPLPPVEDPPVYPAYLQADAVPYKPNVEDHVVDPHTLPPVEYPTVYPEYLPADVVPYKPNVQQNNI